MIIKRIFAVYFPLVLVCVFFFQQHVYAENSSFKDVLPSHPNFDIIHEMQELGVINGYGDGTFRPQLSISRQHVALLLTRILPLEPIRGQKYFNDLPETNVYYDAIQQVQQAGIMDGDKNGNFNPTALLTRVQLAKVLHLAFDLEIKATYDFQDVPESHWGNSHVRALYSNGITTGDGGLFMPQGTVTRLHYAVFLHRLMNIDERFVALPIEKPKPTKPKPDALSPIYVEGILIASKNYPLPANYSPGENAEARKAFTEFNKHANKNGYNFTAFSTYRSYSYQEKLFEDYVKKDGLVEAARYSARAGESEHQSGLAFDVGLVGQSSKWFLETKASEWMGKNAHHYGFIVRYPKEKEKITGYIYEPWHLRYLGVDHAEKVYASGKTLEEYLGIE
ncbi:D-alanyl-D-alanine carboxypeptidase family protein [Sporosarcina siberiensis]|uniref:D-alanyl-D-alanine carboxypeptidase family protein n=1 Tax=Sporosarcina siberiensis TaxID=1365606 RepID=A0ABW4SH58_9BACL